MVLMGRCGGRRRRGPSAPFWLLLILTPWTAGTAPAGARDLGALIQVDGPPLSGGRVSGSASVPLEKASGGDTPILTFDTPRGPVRLLLDTGATSSLLRPEGAARLGLRSKAMPPGAFRLAGGGANCPDLRPQRLALPPLRLGDLRMVGAEALMLPVAALPPGVDGVLGVPSLRLIPVAIDPLAQRIALGPMALLSAARHRPASGAPATRQTIPLHWAKGVPLLSLDTLAGRVQALADTGAEGLFLSPALAARLHPLDHGTTLTMVGFCGEQQVRRQILVGVALAAPLPAAAADPQLQSELMLPREGLITENPIFKQLGVAAIVGQELLRQRPQLWRLDLEQPRLELW